MPRLPKSAHVSSSGEVSLAGKKLNLRSLHTKWLSHVLTALIATGVTSFGFTSVFALEGETSPPEVKRETLHHRVLWTIDPQTEAILSWSTAELGTEHRVYYDTVSHDGVFENYANKETSFKDGQFTMIPEDAQYVRPGFYHHSHLKGLEPDTTYYVVYASGDMISREFHFRTAPVDDKDFSLLFGGDSRIGGKEPYVHNDRQKMNERLSTLFEANSDIYALVHGGDYCMLSEWRYIEPWLTDHELTTTSKGRLLPITPARGNHDRGIVFEEKFPAPRIDSNYYYETKISNRLSLITLNTEISLAGDQKEWLGKTFGAARPEHVWILASYHSPAYSSVRSMQDGASRRDNWVPLFEQYNVDLVLESHDHALKRTLPIRSGAPDLETGITYIGDGGLGVPQRNPDPNRWWLASPGFAKSAHHCHLLRFHEDKLHVTAYGMEGDVLDDFTLNARRLVAGE